MNGKGKGGNGSMVREYKIRVKPFPGKVSHCNKNKFAKHCFAFESHVELADYEVVMRT